MIPLKEDGSLDINRFRQFSREKCIEMIPEMTESQLKTYISSFPVNEGDKPPIIAEEVDYDFDDPRSGIDLLEFLDKMEEEF